MAIKYEIYGFHGRNYEYSTADKALAEAAYNNAKQGFKRTLSRVVDEGRLNKVDDVHTALKLVQANVPAADFRTKPNSYIVKVLTFMINN